MRVVAGRFRGRALVAPEDMSIRPTSDRVRESVFNVLAHGIEDFSLAGARVIDLFSGTGALGIEAVSRGAAYCLFVEEAAEARALIRRNVEALGLTGETIPNVPRLQFSLGLDYTRPVTNEWQARVAADVNYRGAVDSYFASNSFNIPLASYTLVNLRLGVLNDRWTVTAFARNLTDKRAQVSAINSTQDPYGFLTVRPRTLGLSVERQF